MEQKIKRRGRSSKSNRGVAAGEKIKKVGIVAAKSIELARREQNQESRGRSSKIKRLV
jgi:hypothetical protein